jgi:hypothetical protein
MCRNENSDAKRQPDNASDADERPVAAQLGKIWNAEHRQNLGADPLF